MADQGWLTIAWYEITNLMEHISKLIDNKSSKNIIWNVKGNLNQSFILMKESHAKLIMEWCRHIHKSKMAKRKLFLPLVEYLKMAKRKPFLPLVEYLKMAKRKPFLPLVEYLKMAKRKPFLPSVEYLKMAKRKPFLPLVEYLKWSAVPWSIACQKRKTVM